MKKLKILMLGWEYPPYVEGGLGTHCYYLIKALAKLPVKIYFITPHPIQKKSRNLHVVGLNISQKFKEKGQILSYGHLKNKKIELYTKKIPEIIKKYDFDVIHCQDVLPIEATILAKKLSKKPAVMTVHSTAYDRAKKPRKQTILRERMGMVHVDRLIAVSGYTKDIIVNKYFISPKKISVIINAVKQKKKLPRKKMGKTRYVLYLGRLSYQKGIPYLLEAAKDVVAKEKNVKFLIAGKGRSKYEKKLKGQVKKLGLENHVIFLGYVKDAGYYYKKANIFVMPSVSEPFGITPLEAMRNGTPVIISRQSGISQVLTNCVKFNYWNSKDLAKNILKLLNDKELYNSLRREGFKELKSFNWDNIAKKTLELYNELV